MAAKKKTEKTTETTADDLLPAREAPAAKPKRAPKPKMVHEVVQVGNRIYLRGTDVRVRDIPQAEWNAHGLKGIVGVIGKPCTEETVLTFKSPRAAMAFFLASFDAEEEANENIITGGKADWYGENMEQAASALVNR